MNNYFDPNVYKGQPIYSNDNIPNTFNNQMNYMNKNEIINYNKGKKVTVYMGFDKIMDFKGIIEHINNDYIILSDPSSGKWYLLPKKYMNYIIFDEAINYINF